MGPATSSALAMRPSGMARSIAWRPCAMGRSTISVSIHPGATQFTVTSRSASSTATDLVKEMSAPLLAAIRTALNYFLGREIKEERAEIARAEGEPPSERGGGALV